MIVDHQPLAGSYVVEGTNGRLLVHLTDKRHLRTCMYHEDVKAYQEAVRMVLSVVRNPSMAADLQKQNRGLKGPYQSGLLGSQSVPHPSAGPRAAGYLQSIGSLANF